MEELAFKISKMETQSWWLREEKGEQSQSLGKGGGATELKGGGEKGTLRDTKLRLQRIRNRKEPEVRAL